METRASSRRKKRQMVMAGDSRVSPVLSLKLKPRTATFLPVMVLKRLCERESEGGEDVSEPGYYRSIVSGARRTHVCTTLCAKRFFDHSFISMTCFQ